MFERLRELGEALKNFGKTGDKEQDEEISSIEKYKEFQKAKEEYEDTATQEQKDIAGIEDYPGQTKTGEQILIEEEKQKGQKDDLDKKLDRIGKVLKKFGEDSEPVTIKPDTSMLTRPTKDLNLPAMDLGAIQQKQYLEGLIQQPSSQTNRVDILYNQLRKLGLI